MFRNRVLKVMEMDLDLDEMRAAKWWEVNIPPFGAVIDVDKVEERNMDGWSPSPDHPSKQL